MGRLASGLSDRLGIAVPILNAPMSEEAGPELALAVSQAGGLGMLGHGVTTLENVREHIRFVQSHTDKPFGVGLLFPTVTDAPSSAPGTAVPRRPLPDFLLPLASGPLPTEVSSRREAIEIAEQRLDIAIEAKVPVLACGLGAPDHVVKRAKAAGMFVIAFAGNLRTALEAEASGVDAIVAQGHEAGGHTGRTSTMVLVPAIADAVGVPVIAAGGIVDGRGIAAAFMLGAEGVLLGTRFLATPEARTADGHKRKIVEMKNDDTLVSRCFTGKPSRVLRNRFTDAWRGHEAEILTMPAQWDMVRPLVEPAKKAGDVAVANWPTGQGAMLVKRIQSAGAIVAELAAEAEAALSRPILSEAAR